MPDDNKFETLRELIVQSVEKKLDKTEFDAIREDLGSKVGLNDVNAMKTELKEHVATELKVYDELSEEVKTLKAANLITRDQVLDLLQELKEGDKDSDKDKTSLVQDKSTDWRIYQSRDLNGKTCEDHDFELDCRFAPRSRYVPEEYHTRAVSAQAPPTGSATMVGIPINQLRAGNPYEGIVTTVNVGQAGTFQLIDMTNMSFADEGTLPSATRTNAGGATARTVTVKNKVLQAAISDVALEDVPAYRMTIEEAIVRADATAMGAEISAILEAKVDHGTDAFPNPVTSGHASTLLTNTNTLPKLSDMISNLGPQYRAGASFMLSKEIETNTRSSKHSANAAAEYVFNPVLGLGTVWGYPVRVDQEFDAGGTGGDLLALFGNFFYGLQLGMRATLDVRTYTETLPGAVTLFARARYGVGIADENAIVSLEQGA